MIPTRATPPILTTALPLGPPLTNSPPKMLATPGVLGHRRRLGNIAVKLTSVRYLAVVGRVAAPAVLAAAAAPLAGGVAARVAKVLAAAAVGTGGLGGLAGRGGGG